jgi:pimeloyl-ACP methyl ester carboxylesterase
LQFPVEEKIVTTQWGKAHILVTGPPDGIPLFLWQGTAAPGPFMLSLFSSFVLKYRVYVADVPCQAGSRSEQARFDPDKNELGQWSAQVVTACLEKFESDNKPSTVNSGSAQTSEFFKRPILHAGISFGGGVIIDLARVKPSLISAAALIVPSSLYPDCTTYGYFFEVTRKVFFPMMAYRWLPCRFTKSRVFGSMVDEPDLSHPAMKQQELAFKNILWFPRPARHVESKKELEKYTAPTLVITAEQDVFGGGKKTASRAREMFENCDELVVEELKGTKHVPSAAKMHKIMCLIEQFFAERGFLK